MGAKIDTHFQAAGNTPENDMGSISYDSRRGRLVPGLVWHFGNVVSWEKDVDLGWAFGEWLGSSEEEPLHECPVDKSHKTDTRTTTVEIGLCGGKFVPDFLSLTNHGFPIVSGTFAARLKESRLKGYKLIDGVEISHNTSEAKLPHLKLFDVVGRAGFCLRWRVEQAPNICPYCKTEPILCPGCGWRDFYGCPNCARRVHHGGGFDLGPDGKSLELEKEPDKWIVEAKQWDGSDIFYVGGHGGGWFANRRATHWFEKSHVLGIKFDESLLNTEGFDRTLPDGSTV